jgi:hypothetical protein
MFYLYLEINKVPMAYVAWLTKKMKRVLIYLKNKTRFAIKISLNISYNLYIIGFIHFFSSCRCACVMSTLAISPKCLNAGLLVLPWA